MRSIIIIYLGLFLISSIASTLGRPSSLAEDSNSAPQVESERQSMHEITFKDNMQTPPPLNLAEKKLEANTKEILEKINEVNMKQGLVQKKPKPLFFHFPFSYSRSNEAVADDKNNNFQFSRDPFRNPVLDYLEKSNEKSKSNKVASSAPTFRHPNFETNDDDDEEPAQNFGYSVTDTNPDILPEDRLPGQYIKRKITHYQSFVIPQNANNNNNPYGNNVLPPGFGAFPAYSPFMQNPARIPSNEENAQNNNKARQNWNWPGANLFPIYIRDPFLQMYYAVTNMVEYGPTAGTEGPCKLTPRPQGSRIKSALAGHHHNPTNKLTVEINKKENTQDIIAVENTNKNVDDLNYLDVEDIDVGDDDLVRFTVNLPSTASSPITDDGAREFRNNIKMDWKNYLQLRNSTLLTHHHNVLAEPPKITQQSLQIEDIEDDPPTEIEKAEDISIDNEGSRKVFSKDNTGNGIFIQKLKVRKGGVAIAGPGGIATAGSGGTAIVGPNGIAYTHPDGLAIAGSGTKVVAVDPKIDLNEVIKNSVLNNGTIRHYEPNTRIGKVVAIGPVVYYNRGE